MATSFKASFVNHHANLFQVSGLSSVVLAAFLVAIPLGLLILGTFLCAIGWILR